MVYLVVTTGFVVNLHYCMHKLHSWDLGFSHDDACNTCGMTKKASGCCHDEVKVVKLLQDQLVAKAATHSITEALAPHSFTSDYLATVPILENETSTYVHGPPLIKQQGIYLKNRVLRL